MSKVNNLRIQDFNDFLTDDEMSAEVPKRCPVCKCLFQEIFLSAFLLSVSIEIGTYFQETLPDLRF